MAAKAKIGVLGASGYTGAELVRLLLTHPRVEIALLTADRRANHEMRDVFPQFSPYQLPKLVSVDDVDWVDAGLDLAFCALPHATTQKVIKDVLDKARSVKVVDLSADFRLADLTAYARWYGHAHQAGELQQEAVYGLVEVYRERIKGARLVANPGCYTSCAQLPLVPQLETRVPWSGRIWIFVGSTTNPVPLSSCASRSLMFWSPGTGQLAPGDVAGGMALHAGLRPV